ncbi:hydroxymethylglutaryl-coenzyme A reductase-domain-containing protein [Xylaria sp. FL1777]|nr:hydroxymethylglutaryl-coenzyme A reductase-domain-containing protein [Xylaria sp. FL1777]
MPSFVIVNESRRASRRIRHFLRSLTSHHPIPIVTLVTILASCAYVVLSRDTWEADARLSSYAGTPSEWASPLLKGCRRLRTTSHPYWTWRDSNAEPVSSDCAHFALLTLVFPASASDDAITIPDVHRLGPLLTPLPPVVAGPHTVNAQDTVLSFSVPFDRVPESLYALREIPNRKPETFAQEPINAMCRDHEEIWVQKTAKSQTSHGFPRILEQVYDAYSEFHELLATAQAHDILVMALAYISMCLTLTSLFLSMRRLGSRFSLTAGVLVSSYFALLFGLLITTKLFHVPVTLRSLSEGLPFLTVIVGFEKKILFTQTVLSHALVYRQQPKEPSTLAHYAIGASVKETGPQILGDYAVKIASLCVGVLSGIQGAFHDFCFLAVWILVFDCILFLLFYSAILCIKIEVDTTKRRADIRNMLEDEGISHRVAEKVAQGGTGISIISASGQNVNSVHLIPNLTVVLIACIVLVNLAKLPDLAFSGRQSSLLTRFSAWSHGLANGVITPPAVDPFKIASSGLDTILDAARSSGTEMAVTVLRPIKYELAYRSAQNVSTQPLDELTTGSLLYSLEDPVLRRWIIVALALSLMFNTFLLGAARWRIKESYVTDERKSGESAYGELVSRGSATATRSSSFSSHLSTPPSPSVLSSTTVEAEDGGELPMQAAPMRVNNPNIIQAQQPKGTHELSDEEVVELSLQGRIPGYALEKILNLDFTRAVKLRRSIIARTKVSSPLTGLLEQSGLPYEEYDWSQVYGACCENVIGYMPIPVGVAGPLVLDGRGYYIPMATTEGVLVASTSRGAKAINAGGGAVTVLTADGMARGPCVSFDSIERAGLAKNWLDSEYGKATIKDAFNSTSRFARLQGIHSTLAGTYLFIRFQAFTADAMGMNMISKGVEKALAVMKNAAFPDMNILTLTGNYCTDKKASSINWIMGRGKSIVAEAIIPRNVIESVLKTDIDSLVSIFINKNMIGSAMAGSIGGFNAQAANIVAAIFIATGQDPAQVVESANCITIMKRVGDSLQITVSMPSIEVGTIGGGTILDPQCAMLDLLGVRGPHPTEPGGNARQLARIVAGAVMAGELSLCSALAAGHLVTAHMQHNRSAVPTRSTTPAPTASRGSNAPA